MGTRGVYGLRKDGKDKLTYNHYDSYPTGLGKAISEEIQEIGIKRLRQLFDRLEMVEDDAHPSEAHIQRALRLGLIDDDTSPKELAYYELLRKGQGELKTHIDTQLMIESNNFIEDSLYCEWGYIINWTPICWRYTREFSASPITRGGMPRPTVRNALRGILFTPVR